MMMMKTFLFEHPAVDTITNDETFEGDIHFDFSVASWVVVLELALSQALGPAASDRS